MRFYCATWRCIENKGYANLPEWFRNNVLHNVSVDVSFDQIADLYNRGYHVMITHEQTKPREREAVLMVDIPGQWRAFVVT